MKRDPRVDAAIELDEVFYGTAEKRGLLSPPVRIDERAEFEAYYRDRIMGNRTGPRFLRSRTGGYLDVEVRDMRSGWLARAALERK